jgi:hypothetical protein
MNNLAHNKPLRDCFIVKFALEALARRLKTSFASALFHSTPRRSAHTGAVALLINKKAELQFGIRPKGLN